VPAADMFQDIALPPEFYKGQVLHMISSRGCNVKFLFREILLSTSFYIVAL
jgi:hypothetical protein